MKECAYCGGTVNDDVTTCPHCSGIEFKNKCPICGQAIEGTYCPDCAAKQAAQEAEARAKAQQELAEEAAIDKANNGLVWKTILTVFLPFVGGYFLIKEHVRTGFKVFGIIWCALFAISVASVEGGSASGNVLAVLMCLAPIGLYLFKSRKQLLGIGASGDGTPSNGAPSSNTFGSGASNNGLFGKLLYVGFAALLGYTLIGAVASAQATSNAEASASASPTRTITTNVQTADGSSPTSSTTDSASTTSGNQTASSASSHLTSTASVSASTASTGSAEQTAAVAATATAAAERAEAARQAALKKQLDAITITPTTDYLEYSSKNIDPTSIVKCSNAEASFSATDEIDLSEVGKHTVVYRVALDGQSVDKEATFTVRDTKAPTIKLSNAKPKIEQGAEFDPLDWIESVSDKVDGALTYVSKKPKAHGKQIGIEEIYDDGWYLIDGEVDATMPGTYSLIVRATDKHGNEKTKEILVNVAEAEAARGADKTQEAPKHTYIANLNTHKFHIPGCRDVSRMNEENRLEVEASYDEMISMGYSPCGHCLQ